MITAWDALRFDTPLKWGVTAAASDPSAHARSNLFLGQMRGLLRPFWLEESSSGADRHMPERSLSELQACSVRAYIHGD